MNKIIYTFCIILGFSTLFSQPNKIPFKKYSVAEGLPEETVVEMRQDDKGFIWFTTQNGVVKFDGYDFKVYHEFNDPDDSLSIPIINFTDLGSMLKGKDGKIWLQAKGGLVNYDPMLEEFTDYFPNNIKDKNVYLKWEDEEGNIWFNNVDFSKRPVEDFLCRLDPVTGKVKKFPVRVTWWSLYILTESNDRLWLVDAESNLHVLNEVNDSFEIVVPASDLPSIGEGGPVFATIEKGNENRIIWTNANGLYIFDSEKKEIVRTYLNDDLGMEGPPLSFPEGGIEDKSGLFKVFGTNGRISIIDPTTDSITKLRYGEGPLYFDDGPEQIELWYTPPQILDEGVWLMGGLWSGEYLFSVYHDYERNTFKFYDGHFNDPKNELPEIGSGEVMKDRTGMLWLGTRPGLHKQAPKSRQMDLYNFEKDNAKSLPSDEIRALLEDSRGRIWVGTADGLALYLPDEDGFQIFRNTPGDRKTLSDNRIVTIHEDVIGNIWIGTENGLNRYSDNPGSFTRFTLQSDSDNYCRYLFSDSDGRLWISIGESDIYLINPRNDNIINRLKIPEAVVPEKRADNVFSIYEDSKRNIWIGGFRFVGLYRLNEVQDGFKIYAPSLGDSCTFNFEHDRITYILEDGLERLWIGLNGSLRRFDYSSDCLIEQSQLGAAVSIALDMSGAPWFATYSGSGFATIDEQTGELIYYGEESGLLHNDGSFGSIARDEYGKFYLPNQRGLSVFDPETKEFTSYFEKDGFQPYTRNYVSMATRNGDIWIGGQHGLNRIVPEKLLIKDSTTANVVITHMSINDLMYSKPDGELFAKAVSYTDQVTLAHWQKDLSFEFVYLHYLRSEDNMYSWRLKNYNDTWSDPSKERKVSLTNLSPGKYEFQVKGANADGIWNDVPTSMMITILPPWWKTWWAYLLYGIAGIFSVLGFVRWRTSRLEKRQRILEEKVTERTAEVVAEKERSDELLLNILPAETAEELKQYGSAKAKNYDTVTVLFTDFKGFTLHAEKLTAQELVAEIDHCFKAFDRIMDKYNIEKIKTIGDAYMAAAGLPKANSSNPKDAVKAALAIRDFMLDYREQMEKDGKDAFEIRIGVHTGPVVAGIVGIKKFAYDIWGDTVNLAARMESSGEVGKVNISQETYQILKDESDFIFEPRGKVKGKNIGKVKMYFVEKASAKTNKE